MGNYGSIPRNRMEDDRSGGINPGTDTGAISGPTPLPGPSPGPIISPPVPSPVPPIATGPLGPILAGESGGLTPPPATATGLGTATGTAGSFEPAGSAGPLSDATRAGGKGPITAALNTGPLAPAVSSQVVDRFAPPPPVASPLPAEVMKAKVTPPAPAPRPIGRIGAAGAGGFTPPSQVGARAAVSRPVAKPRPKGTFGGSYGSMA